MKVDTNTKGHFSWYYFMIKNKTTKPKLKINICNFCKRKSLYSKVFTYNLGPEALYFFLQKI